jgi:hypothetical protein
LEVADSSSDSFWSENVKKSGPLQTRIGLDADTEFKYLYIKKTSTIQRTGKEASTIVKIRSTHITAFKDWLKSTLERIDQVGDKDELIEPLASNPALASMHRDFPEFWDDKVIFKRGNFRARARFDEREEVYDVYINNDVKSEKFEKLLWWGPEIRMTKGTARKFLADLEYYCALI